MSTVDLGSVLAGRIESGARPRISIATLDLACRYCPAAQHYLPRFCPALPLTLLVCLVHLARTRARDEVVTMFCKRMAIITKKAREKLDELREQHRSESERLLGVFTRL